jgi:hypothetical protein
VFVGQRDDPFFVDLGATFDGLNIRVLTGDKGQGKDDLAGYSVHSVVMQIPEEDITKNGKEAADGAKNGKEADDDDDGDDDRGKARRSSNGNSVVGVWASTERKKLQVTDSDEDGKGDYVQVSRLGNPLVNEVVIPLGKKDKFNRSKPADDAANFGQFVVEPELAKLMNALFSLGVKETDRTDIVLALLQGVPGLNQQTGKPVDTIKINLATPPSAAPNRFGVLASPPDTAGFPNGRRLTDDVVDIELRVVAGALIGKNVALGDGVDQNDKPFLSTFPYVAAPTSGFDAALKCGSSSLPPCARFEPAHGSE